LHVRSFPGRPLLTVALVGVVAVGAFSVPLAYGDDHDPNHLKHEQQQVHGQVQQAQQDADDSSAEVSQASQDVDRAIAALKTAYTNLAAARDHVADVRAQLKVARAADDQMQAALVTAQAQLTAAQQAVTAGRLQLASQRRTVEDTVVDLYQSGPPQLLALSGYLSSQSPSDLTRKMEYSQTLVEDQNSAFDQLQATEAALKTNEAQVAAAAAQVAVQRDAAAKSFAAAQALRDQAEQARAVAQSAKASVTATLAERRDAETGAKKARKRDLAKLAELKKQAQHIKDLIAAAEAANKSKGFVGQSQGFLSPPITGAPLTSPYGYRINPVMGYYGLHDGDDFGAACGTPLRASADGTVIAEYWSDVYGNRLYMDNGQVNGHDITTNVNHAERYVVSVGDHVTRGQVVGYVGTTGWSTGCHTHFTVLQDGTAVDPMLYLNGNG
jgi:murein DD-endopeptidase MepM/ murein hydrolase activator NlpD